MNVTKEFFNRVCNAKSFANCQIYARKNDMMRTPIRWVQQMAVEISKKTKSSADAREDLATTPWKYRKRIGEAK